MAVVYVKKGEALETALKRFNKKVEKDGIMYEIRKREYYVAPSLKRKLKHERALKMRNKKKKG